MSSEAPTAGAGDQGDGLAFVPGQRVGRFVIRQILGEGGFGIVYEAEQTEPVRRRVALKIIKPGMDSKSVLARFDAERQALALMDHPCVAKVLDGGSTPEGRPFFAMELVRGVPITDHCDRQRLSLQERLELFIRVCQAVHHAHAKGVVHRDLKPSNILVTYEGGQSSPKVIDFGIAKALNQRLTTQTIFTELGQLVGTPEYMSPEQAEMNAQDIDTRSDVYSLGVILYEILSGARPLKPETLRAAGFAEIQRIIREVDPPRPSTRLSTLVAGENATGEATHIASARRTDTGSLTRVLKRDLDWVVMRCLEKDRERRYPAASELADDLRRFLKNEPVVAGPPSASYRARKFVRRHRLEVTLAVAGVVGLSVLAAMMSVSAVREARLRRVADEQRVIAERESHVSAAVTDYFRSSLGAAAPDTMGVGVTIAEVLDRASKKAGEQFVHEPTTEGAVRQALGQTWFELGDLARAETQLRRALELRESTLGPDDPATASTIVSLVEVLWRRGTTDEADRLSERLVDSARRTAGEDSVELADALDLLASTRKYAGDADGARELYAQSRRVRQGAGDDASVAAQWSRFNVALLDVQAGEFDRAIGLFDEILGETDAGSRSAAPIRSAAAVERATAIYRTGDLERAMAGLSPAVAEMRDVFGSTHWRTREAIVNLASLSAKLGDEARAEQLYLEALPGYRRIRGQTHPHTIVITSRVARLLSARGEDAQACTLVSRALSELRADPSIEPARVVELAELERELCTGDAGP